MAKKKKVKPIRIKKPADPERRRRIRGIALRAALAVVVVVGGVLGMRSAMRYVDRDVVYPVEPPNVVLTNRPVWMSDFLAGQIAEIARPRAPHSLFDHQVLVETTEQLRASPWIREVRQVRLTYGERPGDTLEVDCDYRAPVAMVRWGDYLWLVDGEGVKLPEQFPIDQAPRVMYGRDGRTNIRIIEGVRRPPPESGATWSGDDLRAGLELVKLLYGRAYTEEIETVDVSNFNWRRDRREAQLVLVTRYDTHVRWGQPVGAADALIEISPARKLDTLREIYTEYGQVDAHLPWIDIRYEWVTAPFEPESARMSGG